MSKVQFTRNDFLKDPIQGTNLSDSESEEWSDDLEPDTILTNEEVNEEKKRGFYSKYYNNGDESSEESDDDAEDENANKIQLNNKKGERNWNPEIDKCVTDKKCNRDYYMYSHPDKSEYKSMLIVKFRHGDASIMNENQCKKLGLTYNNIQNRKNPYTGFVVEVIDKSISLPPQEEEDMEVEEEEKDTEVEEKEIPKVKQYKYKGTNMYCNFYEEQGATIEQLRKKANEIISIVHAADCKKLNNERNRKKNAFYNKQRKFTALVKEKEKARKEGNWERFNQLKNETSATFINVDAEYVSDKGTKKHNGHRNNHKTVREPIKKVYPTVTLDI